MLQSRWLGKSVKIPNELMADRNSWKTKISMKKWIKMTIWCGGCWCDVWDKIWYDDGWTSSCCDRDEYKFDFDKIVKDVDSSREWNACDGHWLQIIKRNWPFSICWSFRLTSIFRLIIDVISFILRCYTLLAWIGVASWVQLI